MLATRTRENQFLQIRAYVACGSSRAADAGMKRVASSIATAVNVTKLNRGIESRPPNCDN